MSVVKTFAVMAIGAAFRRAWKRDLTVLNDLAMQLFVPCLAFNALLAQRFTAGAFLDISAAAALVVLGTLLAGGGLLRLFGVRSRGLLLPVAFMNTANLPFPILAANFGDAGLGLGVVFYVTVTALLFSVGILIVSRTSDLRALLRTPVFVATLLAIACLAAGRRPPALVMETTGLLGGAAIPLILFSFGYSLAGVRLRAWRTTLVASALRLAGGFALGLAAVALLGLEGLPRKVVILVAAMPSAVITVAIAERYRRDPELVASVVFVTTAAALVLLPPLLLWLRS